jgi:hypothetical protein
LIVLDCSIRPLIDYHARTRSRGRYAPATGQTTQDYREQTFGHNLMSSLDQCSAPFTPETVYIGFDNASNG